MKKLLICAGAIIIASALNAQNINCIAGNQVSGYSGDGGQATSAELYNPADMVVDTLGNIFISDYWNNRIRKVATSGIISTSAGNGVKGYSGDGGASTAAELNHPIGIALDSLGYVYFADNGNNRIRKINRTTGKISTVIGNGTSGFTGDGGLATAAEISGPFGVALDRKANIFIADNGNSRVRKVNWSTGIITTIAGDSVAGYNGDGIQATASELFLPGGIALDNAGNLYIADFWNNRIRVVTASTGIISTIAGNGTVGFTGDGGPSSAAEIDNPTGIEVDSHGNVFFADNSNERIREISATSGNITTAVGNGSAGYWGNGGPAIDAEIHTPYGVRIDKWDNMYIADNANNCIRKLNIPSGISDIINASDIQIYPNPSNGIFTIHLSAVSSQWSVEVFNILGDKIYSNHSLSTNHYPLDLNNQPNGIYLVRILNKNGTLVNQKKIIKTN